VSDLHAPVLGWFDENARDLPWRRPGTTAWGVLVSEVMLQQTPVRRVSPVYETWMQRWPTPGDLAASPAGEAIRAWGRLGYPRRALRLHAAAGAIVDEHGGSVPAEPSDLRRLPGIGEYTAAAVAAFAYRRRVVVLDTNVRRVLSRVSTGQAHPRVHLTAAERALAESLLPADDHTAARWSVAVMELGALLCTASAPRCDECPVAARCAWLGAGRPTSTTPRRRQPFDGTDRQARGRVMALVRSADRAVTELEMENAWQDDGQRRRVVDSLLGDGLLVQTEQGYELPG
jgi:A/G-specific adenine glycosylase